MLILVRHGQTEVNATGRLQGRIDAALTDLGKQQAAAIAASIARPGRVVSSPLQRARATADAFGVPVEVDDRWIELDYGELDGAPISSIPASMWEGWRSDATFAPPGGESLVDVGQRVKHACGELAVEAMERDIVVVSHVSPIKAAIAWALDVDIKISWRMHLDVAAICRIASRPQGPALLSYNERSHLSSLAATSG